MRFFIMLLALLSASSLWAQGTDFFVTPPPPPKPPAPEVVPPPVLPPPPPLPPEPEPEPEPPPVVPEPLSISDVIFLLDASGSMDAYLSGQKQSKWDAAREALGYFARNMQPGTRFQLWTFNARITQLPNSPEVPATAREVVFEPIGSSDSPVRNHLLKQLDGLETRGGTNLYQAVHKAVNYFQSSAYQVPDGARRRQVVVVLADGQDDQLSGFTLQQVLQARQRFPEVVVRTIGFGVSEDGPLQQVLCEMAGTPDACTTARDATELQRLIRSFTES